MAAGFGVGVFVEAAAVDSGAGDVVVLTGAFGVGLGTLTAGVFFAGADSVTGDSTTGAVRGDAGDAGDAAAASDATGENGTASVVV